MEIPSVNFLGVSFVSLSGQALLTTLKQAIDSETPRSVCYVSEVELYHALFSRKIRERIDNFSIVIPKDTALIKRIRACYPDYPYRPKDIPDLIGDLLSTYRDTNHSFMFFGRSQLGLNQLGVNLQASFPRVTIMGLYSESFVRARTHDIREMIRKGDVRVIYLGMGSPKDEIWFFKNQDVLGRTVVICVDGEIQNMTRERRDVPLAVRRQGRDGMYQNMRNPFRLLLIHRRVVLALGTFFAKLATRFRKG